VAVRFGACVLDPQSRQLLRDGAAMHLSPKAFDLLALLMRQRPAAVSKADIHHQLWPDTFVSDGNLAVLIGQIREALGDTPQKPGFVRTLHRFGYAFVAAAAEIEAAAANRRGVWLVREKQATPLRAGDNVVGRGEESDIRVGADVSAAIRADPSGVSRRHALFTVAGDAVTVADLSSKNGTFVDQVRVTAAMELHAPATIRLGRLVLEFRSSSETPATDTISLSPGLEQT
jgi:DNA-binding winged helix-turn-helix (wHTH) protein